jgi:hypothetical protein
MRIETFCKRKLSSLLHLLAHNGLMSLSLDIHIRNPKSTTTGQQNCKLFIIEFLLEGRVIPGLAPGV